MSEGKLIYRLRWNIPDRRLHRNFVGVIMRVAYGYSIESLDDTFVHIAEETISITDKTMASGSWLVDYYPIGQCQFTLPQLRTENLLS